MALRARKVSGAFEKPAPELIVVLCRLVKLEFLFVLARPPKGKYRRIFFF